MPGLLLLAFTHALFCRPRLSALQGCRRACTISMQRSVGPPLKVPDLSLLIVADYQ